MVCVDSNPGGKIDGADESTELCRHPNLNLLLLEFQLFSIYLFK